MKIILSTLLVLTLIIAGCGYSIWNQNKENQKAIAWVEKQGGMVQRFTPEWIQKWPKFTHTILKKVVRKDLRVDLLQPSVREISPLKNLSNLKYLYLINTQVSDISPLKNLTNLKRLGLLDIQVSEEQIKELQLGNPKLEIVRY